MKAKFILFVTAFFFFNVVAIAQKQKVKNTNQANNINSQKVNNKATNGNTKFHGDDSTLNGGISPKRNAKQPASNAKVKQGGN